MKVKIGELKTHLSKYVQGLREGGEPVEVCVRDEAVAYLTAVGSGKGMKPAHERQALAGKLQSGGLQLRQWGTKKGSSPRPGRAGDGRVVKNSVVNIRSGKDW